MKSFPREFADLLNEQGRALLRRSRPLERGRRLFESPTEAPYVGLDGLISPGTARHCYDLLERAFSPLVARVDQPMPPRRQWNELGSQWSGTQRNRSIFFPPAGASRQIAEEVGFLPMMRSASIVELAHKVTGLALFVPRDQSAQVSVYQEGDYVGPHCDRLGTRDKTHPYIDFHVSFPNRWVGSQWLLYEREPGYLSGVADLNKLGHIGIYRLPLWHQVTPLVARAAGRGRAKRWLVMGYQNIANQGYHWVGRDFDDFPEDRARAPLHAFPPADPDPDD